MKGSLNERRVIRTRTRFRVQSDELPDPIPSFGMREDPLDIVLHDRNTCGNIVSSCNGSGRVLGIMLVSCVPKCA